MNQEILYKVVHQVQTNYQKQVCGIFKIRMSQYHYLHISNALFLSHVGRTLCSA